MPAWRTLATLSKGRKETRRGVMDPKMRWFMMFDRRSNRTEPVKIALRRPFSRRDRSKSSTSVSRVFSRARAADSQQQFLKLVNHEKREPTRENLFQGSQEGVERLPGVGLELRQARRFGTLPIALV